MESTGALICQIKTQEELEVDFMLRHPVGNANTFLRTADYTRRDSFPNTFAATQEQGTLFVTRKTRRVESRSAVCQAVTQN